MDITPAERPIDFNIAPRLTDTEYELVADLLDSPGWNVMTRLLTSQVRTFEAALDTPGLAEPVKLSLLDRWAASRLILKELLGWPTVARANIESGKAGRSEDDSPHGPLIPKLSLVPPKQNLR